jgi:hypothetical protein
VGLVVVRGNGIKCQMRSIISKAPACSVCCTPFSSLKAVLGHEDQSEHDNAGNAGEPFAPDPGRRLPRWMFFRLLLSTHQSWCVIMMARPRVLILARNAVAPCLPSKRKRNVRHEQCLQHDCSPFSFTLLRCYVSTHSNSTTYIYSSIIQR